MYVLPFITFCIFRVGYITPTTPHRIYTYSPYFISFVKQNKTTTWSTKHNNYDPRKYVIICFFSKKFSTTYKSITGIITDTTIDKITNCGIIIINISGVYISMIFILYLTFNIKKCHFSTGFSTPVPPLLFTCGKTPKIFVRFLFLWKTFLYDNNMYLPCYKKTKSTIITFFPNSVSNLEIVQYIRCILTMYLQGLKCVLL